MGNTTSWLVIGGAVVAVLLLVLPATFLLIRVHRAQAALARDLVALRQENVELRGQLEDLRDRLAPPTGRPGGARRQAEDYLVPETLPGDDPIEGIDRQRRVPDQLVLSATLGEPLVKAAALGHGVRRALSAESRNRIWFEVRREVRRSRKQRRRDMRAAYRQVRQQAEVGEA